MAIFQIEVVVWTKHISWNHACKIAAMLLMVGPVKQKVSCHYILG